MWQRNTGAGVGGGGWSPMTTGKIKRAKNSNLAHLFNENVHITLHLHLVDNLINSTVARLPDFLDQFLTIDTTSRKTKQNNFLNKYALSA